MWNIERCSAGERAKLAEMRNKFRKFQELLSRFQLPSLASGLEEWYQFMNLLKFALGNTHSDHSFIATLLAKEYLREAHPDAEFDAAGKSIAAPGVDIDIRAADGGRIVGEVKTLSPYLGGDFGGSQRKSVIADLDKLSDAEADFKYFFVTERETYEVLMNKYGERLQGIKTVWLLEPKESGPLPVK